MNTPPVFTPAPQNPFLMNLSPEQLIKMIDAIQDGLSKKTISVAHRGSKKFELMGLQDTLKWKIERLKTSEDVDLWGSMVGLPVMIRPRGEFGTITGKKDAFSVMVEYGDKGAEDDFYPSELDVRVPAYLWRMP